MYKVKRGGDILRQIEEVEAYYHGCYGVIVFNPSDAVRVRVGEPVAAADGAGAYRRHDPRHLRQSLLHSAGVLVYLQKKGGESIILRMEYEFSWGPIGLNLILNYS